MLSSTRIVVFASAVVVVLFLASLLVAASRREASALPTRGSTKHNAEVSRSDSGAFQSTFFFSGL